MMRDLFAWGKYSAGFAADQRQVFVRCLGYREERFRAMMRWWRYVTVDKLIVCCANIFFVTLHEEIMTIDILPAAERFGVGGFGDGKRGVIIGGWRDEGG